MEGRFVHVNGVNYYVSVIGSGMPVLLLHGFTGSHKIWNRLVDSLKDKYTLIVPDLLGHGQTACSADQDRYSMDRTVTDLACLLDILHISKCVCLGYSMGGRIGMAFAYTHQKRTQGLILESASPGLASKRDRDERICRDRLLADRIEAIGIEAFAKEWANIPLFASHKRLPKNVLLMEQEIRLAQSARGLAQSLRGIGTGVQPSYWNELTNLQVPTLLITGELDEKFSRLAASMVCQIPNARHQLIDHAGHTVHLEQPHVYNTVVIDCLRGWSHG